MPIATGATIFGTLGKLFGDARAAREARRGRRDYKDTMGGVIAGAREDIDTYLRPDASKDFLQTAEATGVLEKARTNLRDMTDRITGGVARTGGTTEAGVAAQEGAARTYSDLLSRITGMGTQYRQFAQRNLMSALQGLRGVEAGHAQNLFDMSRDKAHGHAQAGQNWLDAWLGFAATDPQVPDWLTRREES